jgi:hypothetical protein
MLSVATRAKRSGEISKATPLRNKFFEKKMVLQIGRRQTVVNP